MPMLTGELPGEPPSIRLMIRCVAELFEGSGEDSTF
jgi:hypothetical protein